MVIKFVSRWAFRLVVLAIVLAVGAYLLKDHVARHFAEQRIRSQTGFDVKIAKLEFDLFAPTLRLENLMLYNPPEFGGSPILDIPELFLEYSRKELALNRVHLKMLRLNIRELHIVESAAGRTNILDLLKNAAPETFGGGTNQSSSRRAFAGVDMFNLSVDRVRYTNLRLPRRNQEVKIGIRNEVIQNVRSEQDLTAILFKVLLRAGIPIYTDTKPPPAKKNSRP